MFDVEKNKHNSIRSTMVFLSRRIDGVLSLAMRRFVLNSLFSILLCSVSTTTRAFVVQQQQKHRLSSFGRLPTTATTQQVVLEAASSRSTVVDEDGPTPDIEASTAEIVDNDDIPELHYDASVHPVLHQPWRRGTTEGCHDPIEAEWRVQAESTIKKASRMVGGTVLDVTWYLTQLVITVDHSTLHQVDDYTLGPEIVTIPDDDGPEYFDPEDPTPEPIWADDEEYLFERDVEREQQLQESLYTRKEDDDDDDDLEREREQDKEHAPLFMERETREDMVARSDEEEARLENMETEVTSDVLDVNTAALSTVARSILEALETVEDDLHILERHEVILTEPNDSSHLLETQREFDNRRGQSVMVETQDPFGSNRTLKGKLMDRNAMDVIINQKGRMVTIPLNFVKCVKVPYASRRREDDDDSDEYDVDEEGLVEEEL